jgi:hypothetical protein
MHADPGVWARLDAAVQRDPGGRGVATLGRPNPLEAACLRLADAESVLVVSGFLHVGTGLPETDGVLGALVLGRALEALGKAVHWVTDAPCRMPFEELGAVPLVVPDLAGLAPGALRARLEEVVELTEADTLAFVERPGRNARDECRNIHGEVVPAAPLDELLELGLPSVAVGDGGNEAGMGALDPELRARLCPTECGAVRGADELVIAGISDWGAFALAAGLGLLAGVELLPLTEEVAAGLEALGEVGCVDGVTGEDAGTVDGLPAEIYLAGVDALHRALQG